MVSEDLRHARLEICLSGAGHVDVDVGVFESAEEFGLPGAGGGVRGAARRAAWEGLCAGGCAFLVWRGEAGVAGRAFFSAVLTACCPRVSCMTSEVWLPLAERLAGAGREGLREGIPVALRRPLRAWIRDEAGGNGLRMVERVKLRLGLAGDDDPRVPAEDWLGYSTKDKDLLNIADAILSVAPKPTGASPASEILLIQAFRKRTSSLQELLDDARSVYAVKADGSGLERRAGVIATRARVEAARVAAAKPDAGSAARHLRDAWSAAHALKPDPVLAYSEAVKAVEAAAHTVVEPGNARATLGTMIGQLRASPSVFRITLAGRSGGRDVAAVTAMMALLWEGQTSRHGGKDPTRPESVAEARMAVHLAVTLVEWFVSGAVSRA